MKTCSKCSIEKPLTEFWIKQKWCKECKIQYRKNNQQQHYQNNQKYIYKKQGIYEWYENDICLYVGQSIRLNSRMESHRYWFKNPHMAPKSQQYLYTLLNQHLNPSIRVVEECLPEVLLEREKHYINIKNPLYNK